MGWETSWSWWSRPGARNWYYPAVTLLAGIADPWTDLGQGHPGSHGVPRLSGAGMAHPGTRFLVQLEGALESAQVFLVGGRSQINQSLRGAVLVPSPEVVRASSTDAQGSSVSLFQWPSLATAGLELFFQAWIRDPVASQGFAVSNDLGVALP